MSIVYHTNKATGVTYAFESTPRWDPEKKQSRPVRTYLGRVDPVSHEIIPSTGRRGRVKRSEDPIHAPEPANPDYKDRYEQAKADAERASALLLEAKARIKKLEGQLMRAQNLLKQFNGKLGQALQLDE